MSLVLKAHFDGKVFVPDEPIVLPAGQELRLHVEVPSSETQRVDPYSCPPGIKKCREAFLRDLPEMLKDKKLAGKWVLYHEGRRVGVAKDEKRLVIYCNKKQIPPDEWYTDLVVFHPPSPEEVDPPSPEFEE